MKNKLLLILFFVISGCAQRQSYNGSVKMVRLNGDLAAIEVELMDKFISVKNRDEADKLIAHLESLTKELKTGRDQFKIQETVTTNGN